MGGLLRRPTVLVGIVIVQVHENYKTWPAPVAISHSKGILMRVYSCIMHDPLQQLLYLVQGSPAGDDYGARLIGPPCGWCRRYLSPGYAKWPIGIGRNADSIFLMSSSPKPAS